MVVVPSERTIALAKSSSRIGIAGLPLGPDERDAQRRRDVDLRAGSAQRRVADVAQDKAEQQGEKNKLEV